MSSTGTKNKKPPTTSKALDSEKEKEKKAKKSKK